MRNRDNHFARARAGVLRYRIQSAGLSVEAAIDPSDEASPENKVPTEFITQRFVGYAGAGNAMYRINVEQPGLLSVTARVQNATGPGLERLGLLDSGSGFSALFHAFRNERGYSALMHQLENGDLAGFFY
jgi:hypothetical protein